MGVAQGVDGYSVGTSTNLRRRPGRWTAVQLPPDAASPARARRFVEHVLDECPEEVVEVASLLTTELVANVVRHAGTPMRIAVGVGDGRARIEVSDSSFALPMARHDDRGADTGRGVVIIERLADAWGVAPFPGGKTVWVEVGAPVL